MAILSALLSHENCISSVNIHSRYGILCKSSTANQQTGCHRLGRSAYLNSSWFYPKNASSSLQLNSLAIACGGSLTLIMFWSHSRLLIGYFAQQNLEPSPFVEFNEACHNGRCQNEKRVICTGSLCVLSKRPGKCQTSAEGFGLTCTKAC
ncbi:unnamed protein product [Protopolystoma xenopodis]|uniref:Uncharacterized protein n=1 Tax=Protopolystoma xenopodis TaxID=117903 RepID=A0A3S5A8R1_9PLAT|nr:unnamed protein product [Protopolystoma xenopodis]